MFLLVLKTNNNDVLRTDLTNLFNKGAQPNTKEGQHIC